MANISSNEESVVRLAQAATSIGAMLAAGYVLRSQMKDTKPLPAGHAGKVLSRVGLPSSYPIVQVKNMGNAAFTTIPEDVKQIGHEKTDWLGLPKAYVKDSPAQLARKMRTAERMGGMIAADPAFYRAGILAHEGGHAQVAREGGLGAFSQEWLRPIGSVGSLAALLSGAWGSGLPTAVRYALIASAPLGMLPALVSEHQATARARKALERMPWLTTKQREAENQALSAALGTYWTAAVAPPMAALGALAYLNHRLNN